ncbi:MAG: hypothetical protein RLZZ41_537 [Actinomycetota bacterium]|jgi:cation-transporting ATPase E
MQLVPEVRGLTSEEVSQRVKIGKVNKQTFETSRSLATILRANIFTLFNAVVGGAFLLLLALGQWQDALFGLAVVSNILIGVIQEYRSKRILDKLAILNQSLVTVRRDGTSTQVRVEDVVVDDVLELYPGDQLPADATLLHSKSLELDESLLSGESEPVAKVIGSTVLAGSGVISGSGLATVTKVGDETYSSSLIGQARVFSVVASEIRQSLDKLIRWISWILGPITILVVYAQLQASQNQTDALVRATASVISMVPQGLVLITSIAFGIAVVKLARQGVLLQELAAVEVLARVDLICFDKTGTLTDGTMELDSATVLTDLTQTIADKKISWEEIVGEFAFQPNPNRTALALQGHFAHANLKVTESFEFNSEQKYSSLVIAGTKFFLGAPEILTEDPEVLSRVTKLAEQGKRTLLLAVELEKISPWVLFSFSETIRPEASKTLEYFKSQGVGIRVLSGDNATTVSNVARAAGLDFSGDGFDARKLQDDQSNYAEVLEREVVLGRVTPDQKKAIVIALQQKGHVVAMVGDGVNDALALKQSDLGIAMGTGSAVTKAVANLVLLNNKFESLPNVVDEGRRVIANVERLSSLFLTKTFWAILLAVVFSLMLWEYPVLPRQLSALDGFTIGIPAFLLALLPNPKLYRPGFLKRALMFCIPAGFVTAAAIIILKIATTVSGSWSTIESQTAAALLLSVTGLWVLATLVRPLSAVKIAILFLMVIAGVVVFVLPLSTSFFAFTPLALDQLAITLVIAFTAAAGIELVRYAQDRKAHKDLKI